MKADWTVSKGSCDGYLVLFAAIDYLGDITRDTATCDYVTCHM